MISVPTKKQVTEPSMETFRKHYDRTQTLYGATELLNHEKYLKLVACCYRKHCGAHSVVKPYINAGMDKILDFIDENFIPLPLDGATHHKFILNEIIDTIAIQMETESPLFSILFCKEYFGGSYWDNVKVRKPNVYDVYIQCKLEVYRKRLQPSKEPGWVNLKMQRYPNPDKKVSRRHPYYGLPGLHRLVNKEGYLDTEKVILWIHQTLSTSLGGDRVGKKRYCTITTQNYGSFQLKFRRHGSAFTICSRGMYAGYPIQLDLDFIPCFVFPVDQYPAYGFSPNPVPYKPEIFIVSKSFKRKSKNTKNWLLMFQEQESELINSQQRLKPALRLMKKLNDKLKQDDLSSYFIKNLFLCELSNQPLSFWDKPLSYIFMQMLKIYQEAIEKNTIDFFWHKDHNLLKHIKPKILSRVSRKLLKVIDEFENHRTNTKIVAKQFLTRKELRLFMATYE